MITVLQIGIIIITAKLLGYCFQRYIKLPRVLGELIAGIIIGPSLLGGITLFGSAPLFILEQGELLPPTIHHIASIASVILLFIAGLETDVPQFLRFSGIASLIALGGFFASFLVGSLLTVLFVPYVDSIMHPTALLLGTMATATSVGMTARILTDMQKMSTPEAVSILAAAVLDDVLGILMLTIVLALIRNSDTLTSIAWGEIGIITLQALGFWIGCSIISIALAPRLVRSLKQVHSMETIAGIILGIALILSFLSELSGLALIIGGYIAGLALSRTDIANELRERLHGVYQFFIPIFFASMGMMINLKVFASPQVIIFGLVFAIAGIAAKIAGCGFLALIGGFRPRGALRIGLGMIPRGEVTLIIAGTGLTVGAINQDMFGVAFITLLISSIIAPPLLQVIFQGGTRYRKKISDDAEEQQHIILKLPSIAVANFLSERILATFRSEEYFVNTINRERTIHQIRKEEVLITLEQKIQALHIISAREHSELIRLLLVEAMIELQDMFKDLQNFKKITAAKNLHAFVEEKK